MRDEPHASESIVEVEDAVIPIGTAGGAIGPYRISLRRGEIASIVGPSGSGKSTLVAALVGHVRPIGGRITVHADRSEVGYVPQNASERLNRMAGALRHMRDIAPDLDRRQAADWLARFRIPTEAMTRPVGTFSAGQQQRLVLLTTLLRRRKLIVLDEPTSALDVEMRQELALILRQMADHDGIGILIATHHLPFVSLVSHRIWRLTRTDAEAA